MSNLHCPEPPTEPRNFWLPESPDGCEHENCGDPDHSKLCATCNARLCPEHARRCECDSYHCASCLFKFQDMELCLTCLKKAEEEKAMESTEIKTSLSIMAHCWEGAEISIDRDICKESGRAILHIGAFPMQIDVFLKPANEAALLAALTKGQPQPVVALLESVPVEDSAVSA